MRRIPIFTLLLLGLLAGGVAAEKQPKCPLPLDQCLLRFELMKTRPWLGVQVSRDSVTGKTSIATVTPGGPADRAGLKPGDVLERIDGRTPEEWFAGRAGWKPSGDTPVAIVRAGKPELHQMPVARMPEELLTRLVGEHMLEGHLAWMEPHERDAGEPDRH